MKVIAINGSPNREGNTFHALRVIESKLEENGIDLEIIHIGNKPIRGCIACGKCRENRDEKCSITTDSLNEWIQSIKAADGLILGCPVHYSGIPGTMKCFLDRAFYVSVNSGGLFRHKIAAAIVAVRRTGGSATLDSLYHFLAYSEMVLATSNYWNVIHGRLPGEVIRDEEGVQIMEVVGNNMAWLLKMRERTKDTLLAPAPVQKVVTNFVR
jgi:multimeric flavodoxin WrbA